MQLWSENITSILEEKNVKVSYGYNKMGDEETLVKVVRDDKDTWIPLEEYLENEVDESVHEILRRNVVTATRNYNHSVKSFVKEIMMNPSNPMSVQYYSCKLEFQGRGAAHNHVTLWINMKKMEFMMDSYSKTQSESLLESNLTNIDILFEENEHEFKENVKEAIQICKIDVRPKTFEDSLREDNARLNIKHFADKKIVQDRLEVDDVLSRFKFVGLTKAFQKFQTHENLLNFEESSVKIFANEFISVPKYFGRKIC